LVHPRAKVLPIVAADFRSRSLFNRALKVTEAHDQSTRGRGEQGHVLPRASQQNPVLHKFDRQFPVEEPLNPEFFCKIHVK
jgi:hypothetical protein